MGPPRLVGSLIRAERKGTTIIDKNISREGCY